MKLKKEKLTKANIAEAYKNLFGVIGHYGNFNGYKDTIYTFELCSAYGIELKGSTIDKIELNPDGRLYFYYNQNTNDLDPMECFSFRSLKTFYNALVDAWNEEAETVYMENCDED